MAKIAKGSNAVQVGSAFVRHQVDGYREKLQGWVGKQALRERGGVVTTGAPQPAARSGSRRKGSTCASEVSKGPRKPKRRKENVGDVMAIAPASTTPMPVGGRGDRAPREAAPQGVPDGHTQPTDESLRGG